MEELKRLKLTQLSKDELKKREMNLLRGGNGEADCCGCGYGTENRNANSSNGYGYSGGGSSECWGWAYSGEWYGTQLPHC